jgi:hypothetical protein
MTPPRAGWLEIFRRINVKACAEPTVFFFQRLLRGSGARS